MIGALNLSALLHATVGTAISTDQLHGLKYLARQVPNGRPEEDYNQEQYANGLADGASNLARELLMNLGVEV